MDGVIEQQSAGVWSPVVQAPVSGGQEMPAQERALRHKSVVDGWENQMADHERFFNASIDTVKRFFIFGSTDVEQFLRSHRALVQILLDAVPHFKASFGDQRPLALEVITEDRPPQVIYALAMWDGETAKSRVALADFDQKWWLANSRKAGGRIVFDCQLV